MKKMLFTLLFICSATLLFAQTPRFSWSSYPDSTKLLTAQFRTAPVEWQSIYYPSNFPTAPSGKIINVYVRVGAQGGIKPVKYPSLTVKMGYTTKSKFSTSWFGGDSIIQGLTTVFQGTNFVVSKGDSEGAWIQIALSPSFYYDNTKNFVFDIACRLPSAQNGFDLFATNRTGGLPRTQGSIPDSVYGSGGAYCLDFGFDIVPNSVASVSNIAAFSMFPNPAHGFFTVELQGKQTLANVHLSLSSVTGQEVFQQSYHPAGSSFSTEVAPGQLASGLYFLKLEADGETITRKLLIE